MTVAKEKHEASTSSPTDEMTSLDGAVAADLSLLDDVFVLKEQRTALNVFLGAVDVFALLQTWFSEMFG